MPENKSALTQYDDFYQMLSDSVRMKAYEQAIQETIKPGDVVLDLGAGTGILSFLALKAGAAKVYAIEKSDSIELARAVAEHNGLLDKIEFINKNSKEVELPEKVDVMLSETLGSFGIDESTLDFTLDARLRLLKPDGRLIPQRIRLEVAPVEAPHCRKKIDFWKEISGVDFSPALEVFSRKLMVESMEPEHLLASPNLFADIDFQTWKDNFFENKILFKFEKAGQVDGFAGWFHLQLSENVSLTTAPGQEITHWKQAFLPIQDSIEIIEGDYLELTLGIYPKEENSDDTTISYKYRCSQLGKE